MSREVMIDRKVRTWLEHYDWPATWVRESPAAQEACLRFVRNMW